MDWRRYWLEPGKEQAAVAFASISCHLVTAAFLLLLLLVRYVMERVMLSEF